MNLKQYIRNNIPETIILGAIVFYWFSTSILLNPLAIILSSLLLVQIFFKNSILGIILPAFLIFGSLFMLLALGSELLEFPTFNQDAWEMLIVGLLLFLSIIRVSILMIIKNTKSLVA